MRNSFLRQVLVPIVAVPMLFTACGGNDLVLLDSANGAIGGPGSSISFVSPDGRASHLEASDLTPEAARRFVSARPDLIQAFRSEGDRQGIRLTPTMRGEIGTWARQLKSENAVRELRIAGVREAGSASVGIVIRADERGRIVDLTTTDASGETQLTFVHDVSGAIASSSASRSVGGAQVLSANLSGDSFRGRVSLDEGTRSANQQEEEGPGDCGWAIAAFISAVFLYEGIVAGAAIVAAGLVPGLGPIAIYAIIASFLGGAGAVAVAARNVSIACGASE